ncbi:FHA domain-containing protein [Candidatus Laterigemmans baculatus]|uniref:FHA domain-containing protein n=1 Tax=Candidatus Laterigemmans baculatus TaxID=2770505 RepID=UPI0013DC6BA2|nr:FHA domain-containing protein [Candidatus Laterigemmans baculatus]
MAETGEFGELVPTGGGDNIPLLKKHLLVGRRDSCDIALKFANVSSKHCRLTLEQGYWFVNDLNSRNGTKVDNRKIIRKRLDPGCKLAIAKHEYIVKYEPELLGAFGPPPPDDDHIEEVLRRSLLDRAGLTHRSSLGPSEPQE